MAGLTKCPACGLSFAYLCTMAKEVHMEDMCPSRAGQEEPAGRPEGASFGGARGSPLRREVVDLSSPVSGSPVASRSPAVPRGGADARPGQAGAGKGGVRYECVGDSDEEEEGISLWRRLERVYEAKNPPKRPAVASSHHSPPASQASGGSDSASTQAMPAAPSGGAAKRATGKASPSKGRKRARVEDANEPGPETSWCGPAMQVNGGEDGRGVGGADEMPDFAGMNMDELRAALREQMHKVGTKTYMIAKLKELWECTHRQQEEQIRIQQAKPPDEKKQKRANKQLDKDRATMVDAIEMLKRLPIYDMILLRMNVPLGDVISELRQEGLKVSQRLIKDILYQESIPYSLGQDGKRWKRRKRG